MYYRASGNMYKKRKYTKQELKRTKFPDGEFQFGRYQKYGNPKISDCTDLHYLQWYYKEDNKNRYALKRILELEPTLTEYEGIIITKEEKQYRETVKNNIEVFKELNLAKITFKKNPDRDGYLDHFGLKLKFKQVSQHNYNGWDYFLPVFDDKSIRIKNKLFKVFAVPIETDNETVFHIKKLERIKQ